MIKPTKYSLHAFFAASVLCARLTIPPFTAVAADGGKETLTLKHPQPTVHGTPNEMPSGPNIEPTREKPPTPLQT